jgi:O-antigen ligase
MTTKARVERVAFAILTVSLGLTLFNLLAAETLFGVAALLWFWLAVTDRHRLEVPPFFWPLAGYAALTLASAVMSFDPRTSIVDSKQLVLFLMVPMVMRLARGDRAMSTLNVVIALGAAGALLGVVEYTMLGFDNLSRRPMGSLTHYMTYSGLIMLVFTATVARLLFFPGPWIWPAIAVPALAVALAATQTRNAWIGALVGVFCLLALRQVRLLLAVPVVVLLFFVAAPDSIRNRAYSIVDLTDASNRDRLQMLLMGQKMVRDHPAFGVGPDMVRNVYPRYRPADAVHPTNPHLHNVPVHIAAERGLPALLLWLWFIASAAWGLAEQVRHGPARALAGAGLGAIVAMLAAGLFEYNFGDSEFLMLFLALITLPYAARLDREAVAAAAVDRASFGGRAEARAQ